jgi:hypothetical protein
MACGEPVCRELVEPVEPGWGNGRMSFDAGATSALLPSTALRVTLEDLLAGKKIDTPAKQEIRSSKQPPKAKSRKSDDAKLF